MIEYYALNTLRNSALNSQTPDQKRMSTIAIVIAIIIIVLLYIWAFSRAMKCSSANPDSRAIHFAFASFSPILYIIFSYFIPGWHPSN